MSISSIRMLAAIMFTDMVGYTALMQKDEKKAKHLRDRHRSVLEEVITKHQGKILQYYGDGTLIIFGSAIESVLCAIEIQRELQKEPVIPLRIGIHSGDIVYDDEGVYGDGVNIASRIEALSISGAVLFSDKLYGEIKNHPSLSAESLGSYQLKNVIEPIEIFALTNPGLKIPSQLQLKIKEGYKEKNSIAVLPFINMSMDPENEYFSDGITEEILNALTKVEGLKVTSRTSSFAFKGKNEDIREIGNKLNVNCALEGSVRKFGNKVRITAQLINTKDGYHLWSEVFNRDLEDIFEVQDEISRKIANKLRERLTGDSAGEVMVKTPTSNLVAYNDYLKGMFYFNKWTPEALSRSITFFKEAISKEENFALPYSGLSNSYVVLAATGSMKPRTAYENAKQYALMALEKDSNITDSHISLALVKMFYDWDWDGTLRSLKTARELNPGAVYVHYAYSFYYRALGKLDECLEETVKAHNLDPLSLIINNALGENLLFASRFDDAEIQFKKTLELDPEFRSAIWNLGFVYLFEGNFKKALDLFNEARKQCGDDLKGFKGQAPIGFAYALMGDIKAAEECLNKIKEREEANPDIPLNLDYALVYKGLKDYDKVFYYLERAAEERNGGILFIGKNPGWKDIHSDSRFKAIMKRVGLKQ